MNPMDHMDDEFRDSEISSLLGRVGGDAPASNVAYQQVLGRVHRVRQRRAIATTLGAAVMVVGIGTVVIQGSSRGSDRIALDPRAAVVTTPDGATVTTPDGVVVTVITEPDGTTTVPLAPGGGTAPTSDNGSNPGDSIPDDSSGPSSSTPSGNTTPNGTNRPAGSADQTTTTPVAPITTPAPVSTKPAPVSTPAPTTTKPAPPTTKPVSPSIPNTTKPSTPGVPAITRPSVPVTPPVTTPPSTPPAVTTITRACGAGAIKVEVANKSFVVASLQTVVLPGFQATIASAKESSIEVRFSSPQGRVTATLKVRVTGAGIKDDCDVEIDKKADSNGGGNDDVDGESVGDNNGERADD